MCFHKSLQNNQNNIYPKQMKIQVSDNTCVIKYTRLPNRVIKLLKSREWNFNEVEI